MVAQTTVAEVPPGAVAIPVGPHAALVDAEDHELVGAYVWAPARRRRTLYASANGPDGTILMHRLIARTPRGFETDHRDGNGLNNRRANLRHATRSQNRVNTGKQQWSDGRPTSSKYKGVCWDRQTSRWQARITVNRRGIRLGRFDDEIDAALAYDRAALAQWGEFARINFPNEVAS